MKVQETIEGYLNFVKLKNKINTYNSIKNRVDKYIYPYFKNYDIKNIDSKSIIDWQFIIEQKNFRFNYKSSLFYTLTNYLKYLEIYYDQDYSFIKKITNFKNNESIIGDYWTIDEFNKFISVINNQKYKIMFKVLFYTGIRKGELLGIKKEDINLQLNKLRINKQLTREHHIINTKSKSSERIISLNYNLCKELNDYFLKYDIKDNDFIFDISYTTLKRVKDYYCELANVKKITIHQFRHSHAILLFQNDVPLDEISFRLGHSKLSMTTDIYLKYLPKKENRVITTLNSLFV